MLSTLAGAAILPPRTFPVAGGGWQESPLGRQVMGTEH